MRISKAILISIGVGVLVWAITIFTPSINEPMDGPFGYYYFVSVLAGIVCGVVGTKKLFWVWPLTYYIGQIIFMQIWGWINPGSEQSAYLTLGLIITFILSVPLAFLGSALGAFIGKSLWSRFLLSKEDRIESTIHGNGKKPLP